MKKKYMILFFIALFILLLFSIYWLKIRRTAYSVAHVLTNINISKDYKLDTYKDEWAPNGDGESLIIFSIPKQQEPNLIQSCIGHGFRKLPIKEELPDNTIYNYLDKSDSLGYYFLNIDKSDNRNYKLFVVNQKNKKLIIYNVIY
jgi:hypothetical protein